MRNWILVLLISIMSISATSWAVETTDGVKVKISIEGEELKPALDAWDAGNYEKALELFHYASIRNESRMARWFIGRAYEEGKGVEKNYKVAVSWYLAAARQGHLAARSRLGIPNQAQDGDEVEAQIWLWMLQDVLRRIDAGGKGPASLFKELGWRPTDNCIPDLCSFSRSGVALHFSQGFKRVEGLPFSIQVFEAELKRQNSVFNKAIAMSRKAETEMRSTPDSIPGPFARTEGSQNLDISKQRSLSTERDRGNRLEKDLSTAFLRFMNDWYLWKLRRMGELPAGKDISQLISYSRTAERVVMLQNGKHIPDEMRKSVTPVVLGMFELSSPKTINEFVKRFTFYHSVADDLLYSGYQPINDENARYMLTKMMASELYGKQPSKWDVLDIYFGLREIKDKDPAAWNNAIRRYRLAYKSGRLK